MEKKDNTQRNMFRQCFMSAYGQRVLTQILIDAGYFDNDLKTTEELAVLNFVKKYILGNLGVYDIKNTESYVRNILNRTKSYVSNIFNVPVGD